MTNPTSSGPHPGPSAPVRVVLLTIFLALPIFLAVAGNRLLLDEGSDPRLVEAESRLDEAISQIEAEKEPIAHFTRVFNRLEERVFAARDPEAAWRKIIPRLRRRFPDGIDLFFLDGSGRPVPGLHDRPVSRHLAMRFFREYRSFLEEQKPMSSMVQGFIRNFLSPHCPLDREAHGLLTMSSYHPGNRFVFFTRPHPQGMFILFLTTKRPLVELAVAEAVTRLNRRTTGLRLAMARVRDSSRKIRQDLGLSREIPAGFWKILVRSGKGKAWFGDWLVSKRILLPGVWVVGGVSAGTAPSWRGGPDRASVAFVDRDGRSPAPLHGSPLALPALFLLILGGVLFLEKLLPAFDPALSVRTRLLGAFLYTVLVPLFIMGSIARTYLSDRRLVLENETHQQNENAIQDFDRSFYDYWNELRTAIANHPFALDYTASDSFRDFLDRFEVYRQRYRFDTCQIFDRSSRKVFEFVEPGLPTMYGGWLQFLEKYSQGVFSQIPPISSSRGTERTPGSASPSGVENPGATPSRQTPEVLTMGSVRSFNPLLSQEIRFGKSQFFLCSRPLGRDDAGLTHMCYILWSWNKMEGDFLRARLLPFTRQAQRGDFFAWDRGAEDTGFPSGFRYQSLVRPFLEKVVSPSVSFRKIVQRDGQTFILTGLRATSLRHFSLMAVSSDLAIRAELHDLAWKFAFVALAIIGACLLIGTVLARLFLDPLEELARGMEAFSRRDFHCQLPVTTRDELGHLAQLFNEALGDLQDLEVARNMQECLFPRQALSLNGWEMFGSCQATTRVGGDYFDYFLIDERRALLIIGHVFGQGIAAALVVAMAKAIVAHPASLGRPVDVLTSLNSILFSVLKRKKRMSCCLGMFEGPTGTLALANAGQTFPVLVGSSGPAGGRNYRLDRASSGGHPGEEVGAPSFLALEGQPLGTNPRLTASSRTVGLQQGSSVVFFTNGLVQALDGQGRPVGFDRLLADLPTLRRPTAVATEASIRSWHRGLTLRGEADDDVSLIVLQEATVEASVP